MLGWASHHMDIPWEAREAPLGDGMGVLVGRCHLGRGRPLGGHMGAYGGVSRHATDARDETSG